MRIDWHWVNSGSLAWTVPVSANTAVAATASANDFIACCGGAVAKACGCVEKCFGLLVTAKREAGFPEFCFGKESITASESVIFEREHAAVLQIGSGNSPASLQIAIKVVIDDTPECITLPLAEGNHKYLDWLAASVV